MKEFRPSFKKGRQRRSTKKTESVKSARRSKSVSEKTKGRKKQKKIQKILEKAKGTKNISNIKSVKKRVLIPKVKNQEGEAVKTRQGIANVFAKFCEDLHKGEEDYNDEDMSSCTDHEKADSRQIDTIPEFTTDDPSGHRSIEKRKKRKTAMEYERNN